MIRSKLRLKALGLCAVVLGVMAFSASAAQAEVGAVWMVKGADIVNKTLLPVVDITEIENKTVTLLTNIAGALVHYLCTGAKLIGVHLEPEGKLTTGGKVRFTGCITILNKAVSAVCVPKSAGLLAGEIQTLGAKALIELHNGEPVTRIEPETAGGNFAVIEHNVAGGCSLPEKVPVKGVLILEDCKSEGDVEKPNHLIKENVLSELYVISLTPEHLAVIDGSAIAELTGTHKGVNWSALPK